MKIKGLDIKSKPYDEATFNIVGTPVTIRARVVTDYKQFNEIFPEPKAPNKRMASGEIIPQFNDPAYRKKIQTYSDAKTVYMLVTSLSETEDLDWETIDLANPETLTMDNLINEFAEAGIPDAVASKIINLATSVNGLTEKIVDTARQSFSMEEEPPEAESEVSQNQ